ncbi:MAG: hypothetical protein WA700_00405 [Acidobacteriaceae bacterium]
MQARYLPASLVLALFSLGVTAQTTKPAVPPPLPPLVGAIAAHPDWPAAKPEDVKSPEAILNAVYDVISGGRGQARDWNRMRSLFIPGARLIPAITVAATGDKAAHTDAVLLTIDDYIARSSGRMTANGFFEHSIHNDVEQFGNIVQIWSTYESRHNADDAKPFARGINSFQLLNDGKRYWIVNIFWDAESPAHPIPAKYLRSKPRLHAGKVRWAL